jgi:hypothetical protein
MVDKSEERKRQQKEVEATKIENKRRKFQPKDENKSDVM